MIGFGRFLRNVRSSDPHRRLAALKSVADFIIPDFRLSWSQVDWWSDPSFNAYLDHFGNREGFHTQHRWMLWQLIRLIDGVEGDTAECGVWKGASSWLICAANRRRHRTHHLFDSFEGLSSPGPKDGAYWKSGSMAAGEDMVAENLKPFDGSFVVHKGWIPDRFYEVVDKTFAFVHVDVDLYQPTMDSVEFFYPRLAPGAILLCDDYGIRTCAGATEALDQFFADKPEKMIALDAGGGFFIKTIRTARSDGSTPDLRP